MIPENEHDEQWRLLEMSRESGGLDHRNEIRAIATIATTIIVGVIFGAFFLGQHWR